MGEEKKKVCAIYYLFSLLFTYFHVSIYLSYFYSLFLNINSVDFSYQNDYKYKIYGNNMLGKKIRIIL